MSLNTEVSIEFPSVGVSRGGGSIWVGIPRDKRTKGTKVKRPIISLAFRKILSAYPWFLSAWLCIQASRQQP